MQGDTVIPMPTDLRASTTNVSPFELEGEPVPRKRKGIVRLTVDIPSSNRVPRSDNARSPPPSRWKTPEFAFYYAAALIVIPLMIWVPIDLSSSELATHGTILLGLLA